MVAAHKETEPLTRMKNIFSILKSPALWTMVAAVVIAGAVVKFVKQQFPAVGKYLP